MSLIGNPRLLLSETSCSRSAQLYGICPSWPQRHFPYIVVTREPAVTTRDRWTTVYLAGGGVGYGYRACRDGIPPGTHQLCTPVFGTVNQD